MNTKEYFREIEKQVRKFYKVAEEARSKGYDPSDSVEIPLARSLAEKVVGLISTIYPQMKDSGITERIAFLEKEYGKLDTAICLHIAEEVAREKFCKFSSQIEAINAGARIAFAYITLGVVSSPIEGLTEVKEVKTVTGEKYLSAYYSGPIRSAGGTGAAFSLVIIDHLREVFGYSKYLPTEEEVKRVVAEVIDYHERITNLQYYPTEEETKFLAENIPIQVTGEPSTKVEVSNYKNLERVETNFIRGGLCLTIAEGLAQKASKINRYISYLRTKGFGLRDWDFVKDYVKLHEKRDKGKTDSSPTYLNDLVAGRPVFGHPSRPGAFRFRYGRGRISGFSAASLNPATMAITDSFIATGTQLKIEKPTKGCAVTVCDEIEGPIVKLFSGSVRKINTFEEAKRIYPDVEEIIYLGDILFPFSDLSNRNHLLIKPGYVEEWWDLEMREKNPEAKINHKDVSFEDAVEISSELKIPLYPKYIFYWSQISREQFASLLSWIGVSRAEGKIILPYAKAEQEKFSNGKRALELLGIEHDVVIENVVISEKNSKALFANLGIDFKGLNGKANLDEEIRNTTEKIKELGLENSDDILGVANSLSKFKIKDKAGSFIGARMGRPEKAKLRKLTGSPNVLFPVGSEGGRLRSVNAACEVGRIKSQFPTFYCGKCNKRTIYSVCENCDLKAQRMFYCFECKKNSLEKCTKHEKSVQYSFQEIDINKYLQKSLDLLKIRKEDSPVLIKGVRGTSSSEHSIEHLSKGVLRAMHGLQVNKDGTVRVDATELPLIAFKPKEVFVEVERLKQLGYDKDIYGNELTDSNQLVELKPHDIILPCSSESVDEGADETFIRVCNFIDSLLVNFYGLNPIYNVKKRNDLIGQFGVCMAPHNCAGVVCRIVGFSNTQGLFASPYMHAAIRRDCDGDEAAVMVLSDVLLNFSRAFLPQHRGGTQDAPLVLNAKIDAGEVDDQILDFELTSKYPLELYTLAEQEKHPSQVKIHNVKAALKEGKDPFINMGFTHNTDDLNDGVLYSSYKSLATMQEKLDHQMALVEKIRAVDTADTARLVIDKHFIKDLRGNLRRFSTQQFRCVECNESIRRPPLSGKCPACGGKIIFTVNEGGIRKYLEPAIALAEKYQPSKYMIQNLELIKRYIESIFGKEAEKQETISKWL